jgi:hypothetical protein
MAQLIILDYSFLFDSESPFGNLFEFEKLFMDFLDTRNMQAEIIKSVEGSMSKRIMLIVKKPITSIPEAEKNPVGRPQTLKGKIKELSDRKFRKPAVQFMKGSK